MSEHSFLYVSSYEGPEGSGIYYSRLNKSDGQLSQFEKVASLERAALMALHPQKEVLYGVGIAGDPAHNSGCIAAYTINSTNGRLHLLGKQKTGAGLPTFISPSGDGKLLFQVSFSSAAGSVLKIAENGALECIDKMHTFSGCGPNPVRQTRSNPHCINLHPQDDIVFVCDLGADQIVKFILNRQRPGLERVEPMLSSVNPGAGPRILRYSQDGKNAYILNELASTISVYHYNTATQTLEPVQVVSTLPDKTTGGFDKQMAAEIRLHPNQKYVYASNRSNGDGEVDGVVVFKRNVATGILTAIQFCPTGKHPRHFNIDKEGQWLFVSARDADLIHRFSIDAETGFLKEAGSPVFFKQPWDIQFFMA